MRADGSTRMTSDTTIDRDTDPIQGGVAESSQPRPWPLVRHSLALAGRSVTRTRRNPGVVIDALLLPVIFLVLFVYLFGGAVSGSTQEHLQYLLPGRSEEHTSGLQSRGHLVCRLLR